MVSSHIDRLYSMKIWPTDPYSESGARKYWDALKLFNLLLGHEWLRSLLDKKLLRILDICAGAGIGGVALSRVLMNRGVNVDLTLVDLREDDLRIGAKWGREVLGRDVRYVRMNSMDVYRMDEKFDIVLMYGSSAPHFDPWSIVRLYASVCGCLVDGGLFLMHECDRRYSIFYLAGYKRVLSEKVDEEGVIISVHSGYDFRRGTFRRTYIDVTNPQNRVVVDAYFWGLAELMALAWMFFADVDFLEVRKGAGIIICRDPRHKITIDDMRSEPRVLCEKDRGDIIW